MITTNTSQITQPTVTTIGAHILPTASCLQNGLKLQFAEDLGPSTKDTQLKYLIEDKIKNKKFFYGIEILARNNNVSKILDYKSFGPLLPLFTSIVWLSSEYWSVQNIEEVESIKLARNIQPHSIVLPHLSCYHLKKARLQEFLNLKFSNVLAVRGDFYDQNQTFTYSAELVKTIRELRGDLITIGVGGYPEGHPECLSMAQDLDNLVKKVQAGADFIITQICFSSQAVIDFVRNCRTKKIKVPILVGIFVPDNLHMLEAILRLTKIKMPTEMLDEYRNYSLLGRKNFTDYAVHKAIEMIETIFASDVDVYGLQFFTINEFKNIPTILNEIQKNKKIHA